MRASRLLAGGVLTVAGLAIFFINAGMEFSGPQLPTSALGYAGWVLVLIGLGLLKSGAP